VVVELPLAEWRHVRGSKLHPVAMLRAAADLVGVRRHAARDVGDHAALLAATWLEAKPLSGEGEGFATPAVTAPAQVERTLS
jgi:hypothetical protein